MLVTLEGLDGTGKTTVWERLQASTVIPDDVTFTREPTDSWYGEAVQRSIEDEEADPLAELFLYTADHAAHLANTVRPALENGDLVISDRYSDSRFVYQGATLADRLDDPVSYIRQVHEPWTRPPDVTIYLDLDAETAAERSGATNKFETATYLASVRDNYERLIADERERFVRIDATQSPEEVMTDVEDVFAAIL